MARKSKQKLADQALAYLQSAISDNVEIINDAEDNLEAYRRDPYGNEIDGRSQFITSDVADTIEWIMPYLMKLFYGGSEVVSVLPTGQGADEVKAKLMNAKVNHDFMQRQNGFIVMHDWVKSALMSKISAVKYYWHRETKRDYKEYEGLTQVEMEETLATTIGIDPETVEVEANEKEGLFDLKFVVESEEEYPKTDIIPPEEFMYSVRSKTDIANADFVSHKRRVHKNYLKSRYGISERDLQNIVTEFGDSTTLEDTRYEDLGGIHFVTDDEQNDFYYIYECYLNDYDKNGVEVPMKVTVFGNKAIETEENSYQRPPFCTLSSIRVPYRVAGMSIAEILRDIQKLHTSLIRASMDNIHYQNNGINIVNPFRVSLDDVIGRKEPGATWRTLDDIDPDKCIAPVPMNPLAPHTMNMMEYIGVMRERRSGVQNATSSLDPNTLRDNKSGAVATMMTAAMQKVELIARIMAETGMTDLFNQYIKMNVDYLSQAQAVKIDEQWAEIKPSDIQGKYDVLVDVGAGTAAKEVQVNQLITLIQTAYPQAMELGAVTGEDYYNLLTTIYELMGYKNTDKFATNPQQDQRMQQMQEQYDQQIQKLQQVVGALQTELQKAQLDKEIDMKKLQLEEMDLRLKERNIMLDHQIDRAEVQLKAEKNDIDMVKARKGGQ